MALHSPRGQFYSYIFSLCKWFSCCIPINLSSTCLCVLLIISFLPFFALLTTHLLFISICVYYSFLKANMFNTNAYSKWLQPQMCHSNHTPDSGLHPGYTVLMVVFSPTIRSFFLSVRDVLRLERR